MAIVKNEINLGVIVPIAIAITLQTGVAVFWGGSISADVTSIKADVAEQIAAQSDLENNFAEENLRQWARINDNGNAVQEVIAQTRALQVGQNGIASNVGQLRADVRETNSLIRDLLIGNQDNGN